MHIRLFASALLATSLAFATQPVFSQAAPPPPGGQGQPHEQLPKPVNLKVLPKNIPPQELIKIMRGYAGALGVECNFCHAAGQGPHKLDFASDAKDEKATARIMIAMTHDMNQNFMAKINDPDATPEDKHVTCGTCHRGHHMPEHFVPPPEEHHGPPPGAPPAGAPPQ
jgi:hypothetical protein